MAKEAKEDSKQEVQKVQPARALSPLEEMERLFEGYFPRDWLCCAWRIDNQAITEFLKRLSPQPQTLAEAQRQLAARYGITIPERRRKTICSFMD
ncbi:MAG: hypothetical protein U9P00_06425 [Pseudomonadota bacterium]|nr:hypothetical protein [Pseudomonadota bacterium]